MSDFGHVFCWILLLPLAGDVMGGCRAGSAAVTRSSITPAERADFEYNKGLSAALESAQTPAEIAVLTGAFDQGYTTGKAEALMVRAKLGDDFAQMGCQAILDKIYEVTGGKTNAYNNCRAIRRKAFKKARYTGPLFHEKRAMIKQKSDQMLGSPIGEVLPEVFESGYTVGFKSSSQREKPDFARTSAITGCQKKFSDEHKLQAFTEDQVILLEQECTRIGDVTLQRYADEIENFQKPTQRSPSEDLIPSLFSAPSRSGSPPR